MTEYMRVDAMRDRWLDPTPPERRCRRRCILCRTSDAMHEYYALEEGDVCCDCRDSRVNKSYIPGICSRCGEYTEEIMLVVGESEYCPECVNEVLRYDYED